MGSVCCAAKVLPVGRRLANVTLSLPLNLHRMAINFHRSFFSGGSKHRQRSINQSFPQQQRVPAQIVRFTSWKPKLLSAKYGAFARKKKVLPIFYALSVFLLFSRKRFCRPMTSGRLLNRAVRDDSCNSSNRLASKRDLFFVPSMESRFTKTVDPSALPIVML